MNIQHQLIMIVVFTAALLSGCRLPKPAEQPVVTIEERRQAEVATANVETPPVATIDPDPVATEETSITTSERLVKPRLHYIVSEGELLWTIAKRPDVYGDPLLWPLLYQSNRDQIKDPRQIYAGQTLTIPRNVSEAEREEARQRAKKSDFFPLDELLRPLR